MPEPMNGDFDLEPWVALSNVSLDGLIVISKIFAVH